MRINLSKLFVGMFQGLSVVFFLYFLVNIIGKNVYGNEIPLGAFLILSFMIIAFFGLLKGIELKSQLDEVKAK